MAQGISYCDGGVRIPASVCMCATEEYISGINAQHAAKCAGTPPANLDGCTGDDEPMDVGCAQLCEPECSEPSCTTPPKADKCKNQDTCSPDPNCDAEIFDGCEPSKDPYAETCQPIDKRLNAGGSDPILYSSKAAITDPFADFTFDGPTPLRFARSYRSNDKSVKSGAAPGALGSGWRHQWEGSIQCRTYFASPSITWSGGLCTVSLGFSAGLRFSKSIGSYYSDEFGETVELYLPNDPLSSVPHQSKMIRRPGGDFVVYYEDGRKATFGMVCESCVANSCVDAMAGGIARLKSLEDARGNVTTVSYAKAAGTLVSVSDAWGHELALKTPTGCTDPYAMTLEFRASPTESFTKVADYSYIGSDLTSVLDADGSVIRSYQYYSPGYLWKIKNEAGDAIVEFGYDTSGYANHIVDEATTLDVTYPDATTTATTHAASVGASSGSGSHGAGGRVVSMGINVIAYYKMALRCFDDGAGTITWRDFDDFLRVTRIARYTTPPYFDCQRPVPPDFAAYLIDEEFYGYGLTRKVTGGTGPSVTVPLKTVLQTSRRSLLADADAVESTDYNSPSVASSWSYVPPAYTCGPSSLRDGSVACRRMTDGYTTDATGALIHEAHATFYTYDEHARLVKTVGPVKVPASPGDVMPIEERTYWPEYELGVRAGRLKEVKRYAQPPWSTRSTTTCSVPTP